MTEIEEGDCLALASFMMLLTLNDNIFNFS